MTTSSSAVPAALPVALLALRLGIAALIIPWGIDKLINPQHAAAVFQFFYFIPNLPTDASLALGIAQLAIVGLFLLGLFKTVTYGAVLAMHAVSTFSAWMIYLDPFKDTNLLFFAAWPALAACFALFLLRREDRLLTIARS